MPGVVLHGSGADTAQLLGEALLFGNRLEGVDRTDLDAGASHEASYLAEAFHEAGIGVPVGEAHA